MLRGEVWRIMVTGWQYAEILNETMTDDAFGLMPLTCRSCITYKPAALITLEKVYLYFQFITICLFSNFQEWWEIRDLYEMIKFCDLSTIYCLGENWSSVRYCYHRSLIGQHLEILSLLSAQPWDPCFCRFRNMFVA